MAGDFNGDGRLDLAVVNGTLQNGVTGGSSDVSILMGNGDGTFQPAVDYPVGYGAGGIVAGDFRGNGKLDLAVANFNAGDVSILMGNGDGTFQPAVDYLTGSGAGSMVAGDFSGDGKLDLAVANFNAGDVSILMGNGDGTFQPAVDYWVGIWPWAMVAGDFSGNGKLDLAVTNGGSSDVSILMGNGDGTFQPLVEYPAGSPPDYGAAESIAAGDFSGNGKLDLAVSIVGNGSPDAVAILMGNGDGTFQPPVDYPASLGGIVVGDYNGDGKLDLAIASKVDVSILMGNGDGTFQSAVSYATGYGASKGIVADDFTGNGLTDLVVGSTNGVSILLNNGDGIFQVPTANGSGIIDHVGDSPGPIATGDFNGDGVLDMAVGSTDNGIGEVTILLGDGDGTFRSAATYELGVGFVPTSIVAGDFNGDGRLDLAVGESDPGTATGAVAVLLGNGDGTFQLPVDYPVKSGAGSMVAGDFSGDGKLDLAVANSYAGDVSILMGNGDGTFQPPVDYPAQSGPDPGSADAMVAGDFSGDGKLDLALAINGNDSAVSILMGNGDGTFQPPQTAVDYGVGGGTVPISIAAGDFSGNGKLDLAVGVTSGAGPRTTYNVFILMGNGDGTFQTPVVYSVGTDPYRIDAGDFNGDGKLDLAVAGGLFGLDGAIAILMGNGDGTFQTPVDYPAQSGPDDGAGQAIVAGDFNGDGKLDLAVSIAGSTADVSILLGNGDGTFSTPGQLAVNPQANPLVVNVNQDGAEDVLVVDAAGDILYRQGIPGQPGSFLPPVTVNSGNPSRDIAWVPMTDQGPLLASVDARDNAVSLYAWRNGGFVRIGSLATGLLPAQIIVGDLNNNGWDGLVVRNAGDGTLSLFFSSGPGSFAAGVISSGPGSFATGFNPFLPPVTLDVGQGVFDVAVVTNPANGKIYLIVTNQLTGQVSVLGDGSGGVIAVPEPYRAGTGLSAIDPASSSEVTSLEATSGVAAGPLTPGGPTDLVTINPGSYTLDMLAGLGAGRFANPVVIDEQSAAKIVRMSDFTGDGLDDLAVLTANGVSIYLANGKGGFLPPVTYDAGTDPTGLTVADLLGNGQLDLLIGNAYGDVLILVGNGDGTFRPYEPVKAAIALAVADLTGNGAKDFVFADQSLNRVTVVYGSTGPGSTSSSVIGNQATGVLAPGAVLLHDMNGDGIPDLVVANSGGNNVLVYPGLGNGQFGPPINGTAGFPVGTDPTGLTVAELNGQPDLLVADTGSNDVSVLLGQGSGSSWTMVTGPRVQTDAGPVAVAVGNLLGGTQTDLAVANRGADNVQVFPGVGGGFFNDQPQAAQTYAVGQARPRCSWATSGWARDWPRSIAGRMTAR